MKILITRSSLLLFLLGCGLKGNSQSGNISNEMKFKENVGEYIYLIKKSAAASMERSSATYRIAFYMNNNNVLPSKDAINILYLLNRKMVDKNGKRSEFSLNTLEFTPAHDSLNMKIKDEYEANIKPDIETNKLFFKNTLQFKKLYGDEVFKTDSTFNRYGNLLLNKILPLINALADSIPRIQMHYFNNCLEHINRFVLEISKNDSIKDQKKYAVYFLISDMQETGIVQKNINKSGTYFKAGNFRFRNASFNEPPSNTGQGFTSGENIIPNAAIYVYRVNLFGEVNPKPEMDAFNIYYDSNGLQYSLTPNCDTLSFFKNHPLNPASTLPVLLADGNYCFVLQDVHSKKLYLKTGINLADNLVYDKNRVVKLTFMIEN